MKLKVSVVGNFLCPCSNERVQKVTDWLNSFPEVSVESKRPLKLYNDFESYFDLIAENELTAIDRSDVVILDSLCENGAEVATWFSAYCWANGIPTIMLTDTPYKMAYMGHTTIVKSLDELKSLELFKKAS